MNSEPSLFDIDPAESELGTAQALWALTQAPGVGAKAALDLAASFATWADLAADPVRAASIANRSTVEDLAAVALEPASPPESDDAVRLVGFFDNQFPNSLRDIPQAPAFLWTRGSTPSDVACVAVVGTRHPTESGVDAARSITTALVEAGLGIVSGLALGIDATAHQAALDSGGLTWAFLGGGVDRPTPRSNLDLAERIVDEGGGLLSEYPVGAEPEARTLVARDRLQSGSSIATVIVQSGVPSGTLHTARFTLEQQRCLAVQTPDGEEDKEPSWEANRQLTASDGCDPQILDRHSRTRHPPWAPPGPLRRTTAASTRQARRLALGRADHPEPFRRPQSSARRTHHAWLPRGHHLPSTRCIRLNAGWAPGPRYPITHGKQFPQVRQRKTRRTRTVPLCVSRRSPLCGRHNRRQRTGRGGRRPLHAC